MLSLLKRNNDFVVVTSDFPEEEETRPRKMYQLTADGDIVLDNWLRAPLTWGQVLDERDEWVNWEPAL